MLAFLRTAALAAVVACVTVSSVLAADKSFTNEELNEAATEYSDSLRESGESSEVSAATLRVQAAAAAQRLDFRQAMNLREQIAGLEYRTAHNWIDLANTILNVRVENEDERIALMQKAAQAAYLGYSQTTDATAEAAALAIISRSYASRQEWRVALDAMRMSLEKKESAPLRSQYVLMREKYGFRVLNFTVDSDPASPRACFQFSENLPDKGVDLSPFVAVAGVERPVITVEDQQLCVEGLKHGSRYQVSLRKGLPSSVSEKLEKAADFAIYVRDRSPSVRFTSKAWVLPKVGQQGIPVVSINTDRVSAKVFRIGDRNLIETVLGGDFQRTLYRYDLERLAGERGTQVWSGEMKVEFRLNEEVLTALPIEETVGELQPGIYALVAEPAPVAADDYGEIATQWFIVSDLGLTALSGSDGIHATVNSLATAAPKQGIEITLLSRSNEELGRATTDANGIALFAPGLARGEGGLSPALLVARDPAGDYAFLNLKQAAFDLADRGVAGRINPGPLDAFVVTERGVYRSGETVHITALMRDALAKAAPDAPLTLVVERPDGVEHRRMLLADGGLGGRSLSLPVPPGASTGTWRVRAYSDPKAAAIGETAFLVEDYLPDRIEFDLTPGAEIMSPTGATAITLIGRYLYGAPAAGLTLEGEVSLKPVPGRPGYDGYAFGVADEDPSSEVQPLEALPLTGLEGKSELSIVLAKLPESSRPLEAKIAIRMAEPGGRAVERTITLPVAPKAEMIGIKPLFEGGNLDDGASASFDVVSVGSDGKEAGRKGLRWDLYRLETNYQWYRQDGNWNYEPVKITRRIANGTVDVAPGHPGRIANPVTWGTYELDVAGDNGLFGSTTFSAGWQAEATADTPDLLELSLDKTEYKHGDTLKASVTARAAGKLTIEIVSDRLLAQKTVDVEAGQASVEVPVGADWGTGAYVLATLRRPLNEEAKRLPGRAIGAQWFSVARKEHSLPLALDLPAKLRPGETLRIPVSIDGLAAGEEARVVVAAVDVGILNLTNYKSPAPDDHYLGQRRLGAELRDLYGQLIDGMQATRGQIVTGGDGGGAVLSGSPPSQAPLALYSGIVTVGPDGKAEISFDLPDFTGSVRVMAFAWSANRLGRAEGEVVVRDPVVLTASLPRFLTEGDESTLRVDLNNVEGEAGDYAISIEASGPAAIGADQPQSINLGDKSRSGFNVPISASASGDASITIALSGPNGYAAERVFNLAVKPANNLVARRSVHPLGQGQSLALSKDLFADLVAGTGSISLSVGPSAAIDPFALSAALQSYPFGCSEQITSEAIALLTLKQLVANRPDTARVDHDARIRTIIDLLLARQGADGSFGLWSSGGGDGWLDAYVTDFLTRAREAGFVVPDAQFRQSIDRVRNVVSIAPEPSADGGQGLAYALYVLARNGAAPVGDLRYLADARLADLSTPIAKAQLAAALAMLGDKQRAGAVYSAALASLQPDPTLDMARKDYGSELRDAAAVVTLAAENGGGDSIVQQATARIGAARGRREATSTQENAWLILAARAIEKQTEGASLNAGGQTEKAPFRGGFSEADLADAPFVVSNPGSETMHAVVTVSGRPVNPEPPSSHGFTIERSFHTLDGEVADPSQAKQNQRFVVVLSVTDLNPQFAHLAVTDRLPAGFEIDNPRLVSSGDTSALDWIENGATAAHAEFRDDRFFAAFDRQATDTGSFSVAYVVRAVSPGRYVLPQAAVEDMYRPERFGRTESGEIEVRAAQ